MKQIFIRKGQAVVEEVPAPRVEKNTILVRVEYSCISAGTEMSGVRSSAMPLWKRALREPEKVKKVFQIAAANGIAKTKSLIEGKLAAGNIAGYSAAGEVIAVGSEITDICAGDFVACAGAQCAHHAEFINVPKNLAVKIPQGVSTKEGSMVTLGAIALQGVRRAKITLGETFVVIGLGIIGQIAAQLLKAGGCRVIVSDLDPARIEFALKHGADAAIEPEESDSTARIRQLTNGIGADGVMITAATSSSAVVSTAFQLCRKKGRVVLVGDVGLHLNRNDFYQKELDFYISTSYGPGRYDELYEEKGLEYPVGYVRWTENRNMEEILYLLQGKKLQVKEMMEAEYPLEKASEAYESLKNPARRPLMAILSYPSKVKSSPSCKVILPDRKKLEKNQVSLAVVGAGGFAKSMHLPNIMNMESFYHLAAIVSRTGHNAAMTAKQFQADYATTDYEEVLRDTSIDAVMITTRHCLHADMALQALEAGKHTFVEKPMAICMEQLNRIKDFYRLHHDAPMLLTGFNRRYSKYVQEIRKRTEKRLNPLVIHYTMNAGYIPRDSWVHGAEGGGRNIGEACHIYDVFNYLVHAEVASVTARAIKPSSEYYSKRDNFIATIAYKDGSIASLMYTAMGAKAYPKETMEVFFDGKIIRLEDYKKLSGFGIKVPSLNEKMSQKGQKEEIEAFAQAILFGGAAPIPMWQQFQAMEIAFAVEEAL